MFFLWAVYSLLAVHPSANGFFFLYYVRMCCEMCVCYVLFYLMVYKSEEITQTHSGRQKKIQIFLKEFFVSIAEDEGKHI